MNIHLFIYTRRRPRFDLVPGSMYHRAVNITRCHFIAREFKLADINIILTCRFEEVIYQELNCSIQKNKKRKMRVPF